jgi:hypothetical protein
MLKTKCCRCKNELSAVAMKYTRSEMPKILSHPKILIMKEHDRMCVDCKRICHEEYGVKSITSAIFIDDVDSTNTPKEIARKEIFEKFDELKKRSPEYKTHWNKNGVIQFKNERIAILQRMWGSQVEFIVAFDDLTKEGYRCIAHDEGKEGGQSSGGFTGGLNSYFYFQKIELVR